MDLIPMLKKARGQVHCRSCPRCGADAYSTCDRDDHQRYCEQRWAKTLVELEEKPPEKSQVVEWLRNEAEEMESFTTISKVLSLAADTVEDIRSTRHGEGL